MVFYKVPDQVIVDNILAKTTSMVDTIDNVYERWLSPGKLFRDVLIKGKKNGIPVQIGVWCVWAEKYDDFLVKPFLLNPSNEFDRKMYYDNYFLNLVPAPELEEQLVTRNL